MAELKGSVLTGVEAGKSMSKGTEKTAAGMEDDKGAVIRSK